MGVIPETYMSQDLVVLANILWNFCQHWLFIQRQFISFDIIYRIGLCYVISVYYGHAAGNKYERNNINWQLPND